MVTDNRAPQAGRAVAGEVMSRGDGPGRTEFAHRTAGTGRDGGSHTPPSRCLWTGHRPRAGLVDLGDVSPTAPSPTSACLPVPATWLTRLRTGEQVKFIDARDAKRAFEIVD